MMKRRALVCGASQGIGQAVALDLAQQGYSVTAFARSEDKLAKLIDDMPGEGHDFIAGDIGDFPSWTKEVSQRQGHQAYSILVCNSGGHPAGPISQASSDDFLKSMKNHLCANSELVNILLPDMKAAQFGRIMTITSTSVKVPIPHLGVSNTARAAVASWAKTLSLELAPFGITVNNVMPGFTDTPRLKSLITARAKATGQTEEQVLEGWLKMVPMNRLCQPEELAYLISFLASDKAGAITGQNISVDGGRLGCL